MSQVDRRHAEDSNKPAKEASEEFEGVVVKWDRAKGCWLVESHDKRLAPIALPDSVLHAYGWKRLERGRKITGDVLTSDPVNGLRFLSISKIEGEEPVLRPRVDLASIAPIGKARLPVKFLDLEKKNGFFAQAEGLPDIFVLKLVFDTAGIPFRARSGTEFEVTWGEGPKGLVALKITR